MEVNRHLKQALLMKRMKISSARLLNAHDTFNNECKSEVSTEGDKFSLTKYLELIGFSSFSFFSENRLNYLECHLQKMNQIGQENRIVIDSHDHRKH